jgi:hypothetical protein
MRYQFFWDVTQHYSLYGTRRDISSNVLTFVLWACLCFKWKLNACACVQLCLYPYASQWAIWGRYVSYCKDSLPDDSTCDVPKHVGDLQASDMYIFWSMLSWLYELIIPLPDISRQRSGLVLEGHKVHKTPGSKQAMIHCHISEELTPHLLILFIDGLCFLSGPPPQ